MDNKKLRIFEMFAGYGTATFALKQIPFIEHELIGYSEIDKYADLCFKQNHGGINFGDATKIDPKELEDFDLLTGGIPCFLEGTLITTHRGQIPIEDVVVGDVVLTHKNRWRKVIDTMNNMRDHYYKVNIQGSSEIRATGNHKFYGRKMIWVWDNDKRNNKRVWSDPEWIAVEDMRKDDFFAIGTWSDKYTTNEKNLTNEECWLLGRYVADGYIQNNKRNGRKNSYNHKVVFCVGKEKKEKFLEKTKEIKYYFGVSEERTIYKFRITNEDFMNLCLECGKGASNKKLPYWIMNLPKNRLKHFLDGYMSGDGCFTKNGYQATTVSKVLAHQLGQIVVRLFKTPYNITFTEKPKTTLIEGRTINQKDVWLIRWKEEIQKGNNAQWIGNNLWTRFNTKEKIMGKIKTYNITIDEDHSYVANNIIVKNCQAFSQAGKGLGELDTRGTLFHEVIRIIEFKQPKYVFLENVKGLISKKHINTFNKIISELERVGYLVKTKLLNTKDFGIPQNRERIWFVCYRKDLQEEFNNFEWPEKEELKLFIKDILEEEVDPKYLLKEHQVKKLIEAIEKKELTRSQKNKVPQKDVCGCLCSRDYKDGGKTINQIKSIQWDTSGKGYASQQDRAYDINGVMCCLPNANPTTKVNIFAVRGRGENNEQTPEFKTDNCANTLTSVEKDNYVCIMDKKTKIANYSGIHHCVRSGSGSGNKTELMIQPKIISRLQEHQSTKQDGISNCLPSAMGLEGGHTPMIELNETKMVDVYNKKFRDECPTLTDPCHNSIRLYHKSIFRRLTPKETFRLQGFLNDEINISNLSDTQCYRLAGNGQTVTVVKKIFEKMFGK